MSSSPTVFITHARLLDEGPHSAILSESGFKIRLPSPHADTMQASVLANEIGDAEAVIAGLEPYNRAVIESAPRLRVVARCGVGYETVDVAACDERGIAVAITPGVNEHSVAEHALAMLTALSRGFPTRDFMVRSGKPWRKLPRPRLAGSTVGIVGLGRIGQALAVRLPSLQVKVLAYEPFPDHSFAKQYGVELTDLMSLLRRSDIVSLHVPVTPETHELINRRTLAVMKRGAILINTARGALVNEHDLHMALLSGHLAAAGLDVLQLEPAPADHPLLQHENVLFSPHIAGLDEQSHFDSVVLVAQIIASLYRGEWPSNCIVNLNGVTDWKWKGSF